MPRQSLQTVRDCSTDPSWEIFWSILSSSAETSHPHKPQSYSHSINSYFSVSIYPGTHSSIQSQCPPSALVTDWSHACEPSSALLYLYKKGDSMKTTTLVKAFIFFPGAKEKCNVSMQAQGSESYMLSKSTVLALALTILPSFGQVTYKFLWLQFFLNIPDVEDALFSESSVCSVSGLALQWPTPFQGSQQPRHLFLLICKTGIIRLVSGSSVDQYLQNTLKNERCCLSTECWPQNLQAVFLKRFISFHIKASYLQAQPTSALG